MNTRKISNAHSSQDFPQRNLHNRQNKDDHSKSSCKIKIDSRKQKRKRYNSFDNKYPDNSKINLRENHILTLFRIDCRPKWAIRTTKVCFRDSQSRRLSFMMYLSKRRCSHQRFVWSPRPWDDKKTLAVSFTKMPRDEDKSKKWTLKSCLRNSLHHK